MRGGDEETEEEEAGDVISAILAWAEEGPREVVVDVGMGVDDLYLQVNGADVRIKEDALRQALMRAFQEELGL